MATEFTAEQLWAKRWKLLLGLQMQAKSIDELNVDPVIANMRAIELQVPIAAPDAGTGEARDVDLSVLLAEGIRRGDRLPPATLDLAAVLTEGFGPHWGKQDKALMVEQAIEALTPWLASRSAESAQQSREIK